MLIWKFLYIMGLLYSVILPMHIHTSSSIDEDVIFNVFGQPVNNYVVQRSDDLFYRVLTIAVSLFAMIGTDNLLSNVFFRWAPKSVKDFINIVEKRCFLVFILPWFLLYVVRFCLNMTLLTVLIFRHYKSDFAIKLYVAVVAYLALLFHAGELVLHWCVVYSCKKIGQVMHPDSPIPG